LLRSALSSLERLDTLSVAMSVKMLFCDLFESLGRAAPQSAALFRPDLHYSGRAYCSLAVLERYPAGQLDWEVSGFPRSWVAKVPARDLPALFSTLVFRLGGFKPFFFAHMGLRRFTLVFTERENNRSYYRMAKSMELQPHIRGLLASAWFYSPETARVSPHLAWTCKTPAEHGALVTTVGPADPSSGFLEGSRERRELFERGEYKPRLGLVAWPRRGLIEWANTHPEFER
jgi:hypothetical protein